MDFKYRVYNLTNAQENNNIWHITDSDTGA